MHIGFLQAYFSRESVGGGEIHTECLARALSDRGHRVTIFTDKPSSRRDGISDLDVREYSTPVKVNPLNEILLAQRAFEDMKDCDVITLTDDSAWRGVDLPIPTVMVFHIVWHGWVKRNKPITDIVYRKPQSLVYRHMEKKICEESDIIVSISPNVYEDILLAGTDEDSIVSIPNGVDIERFSPTNDKYNEFTVYFQGRLVDMKNPQLLIEAAYQSKGDWNLLIGGEGPLKEDLKALVTERGLDNRVEFLGYVSDSDLPKRYAQTDLFVLPSNYEGMPLTILEAAASGTAIIASERAATDFVTDDIGRIVDTDPDDIADTIDELSFNRTLVKDLGMNARMKAENYSWTEIAKDYENVYYNLY